MFPTLHESTITALPTNNGFGVLSDCIECKINETLNGEYALSLTYPLGGLHYEELTEGRILYALRDNTGGKQLFRISEIETDYIARKIQVYAPHISRDLTAFALPYVGSRPVDTSSNNDWIHVLNDDDNFETYHHFTFAAYGTTLRKARVLPYEAGQSVLSFLIENVKNQLSPPWWEMEFNNFNVNFQQHRGDDSEITVRYGKNLTGLVSHEKADYPWFGCIPSFTYTQTSSVTHLETEEKIYGAFKRASDFSASDPLRRAYTVVDFQAEQLVEAGASFDDGDGIDATETASIKSALAALATEWLAEQKDGRDATGGVTVDFQYLDLAKAADYWTGPKPQELTADIGDYVTVIYGNMNEQSEIVAVEYDVIKERYNAITAGQIRPTLAKTIKQIVGG